VNGNSGASIVVAALILGVSIVAGALLIRGSLDETVAQLATLTEAVENAPSAPAPSPSRAARPARPDPSRRYSVNTQGAPVRGNPEAKIAVVEFSDFQCPFCGRVTPTLAQVEREYGDDVRIVFKHLPLSIHPKAPAAHAASWAAHQQGKFWEMHDKIFENQRDLSDEAYLRYATELGLDLDRFTEDLASAEAKAAVAADVAEAGKLGVTGTPGFFINGRFLSGAQPFASFKSMIDEELGRS
jgi:protein-disulfide isomerase